MGLESNSTKIIETEDPNVVITSRGITWILYKDLQSGKHWIIFGDCNCCGQCEIGGKNHNIVWTGNVGEPNAEYDSNFSKRKDIPVRSNIKENCPKCTLWGIDL